MKTKRISRGLLGLATAALISLGIAAPTGFAQDPGYLPQAPTVVLPPAGSGAAAPGTAARKLQLRKCIAKAQTKFGDNRPLLKRATKKCKKKYG
jgi:hypothetical protein